MKSASGCGRDGTAASGDIADDPSLMGYVVLALAVIELPRIWEMIGVIRPNSQSIFTVTCCPRLMSEPYWGSQVDSSGSQLMRVDSARNLSS